MPPASDAVTLERLVQLCETHERVLRWQYPEGALPSEWEDELARWPADSADSALERLAALKHFYRLDDARRNPKPASPADAEDAARQLLTREPVRVELGDIVAYVTARSYAAMYAIACHDARIRELDADLQRASQLHALTAAQLRALPWYARGRGRLRRRLRRLGALHERLYLELAAHRQMLYAHAMTPDGAPAASPDQAPDWWVRIDPAWDAALLAALWEAGPGRYARLGPEPERRRKQGGGESFGWASLFASVERSQKLPAAELYDRDLYQLLTWLRAGAPPELDLED